MIISRESFQLQIMIDQKQLESVECFSYLDSMITNVAYYTREIKARINVENATFNRKKKTPFTSKLD
jgi:hypothetical protein